MFSTEFPKIVRKQQKAALNFNMKHEVFPYNLEMFSNISILCHLSVEDVILTKEDFAS